jgi:hypothetical protein
MLAFPGDATRSARAVEETLVEEWNEEQLTDLQVEVHHWKRDAGAPRSADGVQGTYNETVLKEAEYVIAVFEHDLGQPCVLEGSGKSYPSGTMAEIREGLAQGKTVRVFAHTEPGHGWLSGPPVRSQELAEALQSLEAEGIPITAFTRHRSLKSWVRKVLSSDVRRGFLGLPGAWDGGPTAVAAHVSRGLDLPATHVEREVSQRIQQAWDEGHSRVALSGNGGTGKSLLARWVYREAFEGLDSQPRLIVMVEPANSESVIEAYADAARRLGLADPAPDQDPNSRPGRLAGELVTALRQARWPWLVILDNVDSSPGLSLDAVTNLRRLGLLPPETPLGRSLITTRDRGPELERLACLVKAEEFSEEECLDYLERHPGVEGDRDSFLALAEAVGRLPLALSIAAATIEVSSVSIEEWIERFNQAEGLDSVTVSLDDPDGYPVKLAQVWAVALASAAANEPAPGMTTRAALVSAVLAPTGHPGRLWQSEAIQTYLWDGQTPQEELGRPGALQALFRRNLVDITPGQGSGKWPDQIITMHRLAAKAIQGMAELEECEKAVRACADAFEEMSDWHDPAVIREAFLNTLALIESRGREGLIMADEDGWWAHDLLDSVCDGCLMECVTGVPFDRLSQALGGIMAEGSGTLSGLRFSLGVAAQLEGSSRLAARLLGSAGQVDPRLLSGDWQEELSIRMPMIEAAQIVAVAEGSPNPLEELRRAEESATEPLVRLILAINCAVVGDAQAVERALGHIESLRADPRLEESVWNQLLGAILQELPATVRCRFQVAFGGSIEQTTPNESFRSRLLRIDQAPLAERLALLESAAERLGRSSLLYWQTYRGHLSALGAEGLWEDSAASYAAATTDLTGLASFGPSHPITLAFRHNHAYATAKAGRTAEAIELYQTVLSERIRLFGPQDSATLVTLSNLASDLRKGKQFAEAAVRYKELWQARRETLGEAHEDTLNAWYWFAECLGKSGDASGAARQHQAQADALAACADYGPEHRESLTACHQTAYWLSQAGRRAQAIDLNEELLTEKIRLFGPQDAATLATLSNLASDLRKEERFGEAAVRYKELWQARRETLGEVHQDTLNAWYWFAECLGKSGDASGAARQHRAQADALAASQEYGPNHSKTLQARDRVRHWARQAEADASD